MLFFLILAVSLGEASAAPGRSPENVFDDKQLVRQTGPAAQLQGALNVWGFCLVALGHVAPGRLNAVLEVGRLQCLHHR